MKWPTEFVVGSCERRVCSCSVIRAAGAVLSLHVLSAVEREGSSRPVIKVFTETHPTVYAIRRTTQTAAGADVSI